MQTATNLASAVTLASQAIQPTPSLLAFVRHNLNALMQRAVFSDAERLRANDSAYQCDDLRQLHRWQRNTLRVAQQREDALHLAFADGTCTFLSLTR